MKEYVLNKAELDNGHFLLDKGPVKLDTLPSHETNGLKVQQLIDIDEENNTVALSEQGLEYFKHLEEEAKQLEKEQTESEGDDGQSETGEANDSNEATQAGQSENEADDANHETTQKALESARVELNLSKRIAIMDADNVAMEGLSAVISNTFPGIINGFQGFINAIKPTNSKQVLHVYENRRKLEKNMSSVPYVSLSQLMLVVPEGLQVKYPIYLDALESAVERALTVPTLMKDFSQYAASVITNPDVQKENKSRSNQYNQMQTAREASYATIGACFANGSNVAKRSYGSLVDRNKDWDSVISRTQEIAKRIQTVDRVKLIRESKELHNLLVKIRDGAARGAYDMATPEVVKSLAEGSFQIASELEYYAVIFYRVEVLVNTVKLASEQLEKATGLK